MARWRQEARLWLTSRRKALAPRLPSSSRASCSPGNPGLVPGLASCINTTQAAAGAGQGSQAGAPTNFLLLT